MTHLPSTTMYVYMYKSILWYITYTLLLYTYISDLHWLYYTFKKIFIHGCNFNCFLGLWRELLKNAFRSTVERHFSRTTRDPGDSGRLLSWMSCCFGNKNVNGDTLGCESKKTKQCNKKCLKSIWVHSLPEKWMDKIDWGLREGHHRVSFRHTKHWLELWKSCFDFFFLPM